MGQTEICSETTSEGQPVGFPDGFHARAAAARAAREADIAARTRIVDGYRVWPDRPPGVGTVIEPIDGPGPRWYIGEGYEIAERVGAHRRRYADRPVRGERSDG